MEGSRCRECEVTVFPAGGARCRCCGGVAETVDIGAGGVVETWTHTGEALLAEVRLDSRVLVFGRVAAPRVAVGHRVEIDARVAEVTFVPR